jgi:hypothetical protein
MKEVKKMYERPSMNRILVQIEDGFNPGSGSETSDPMKSVEIQTVEHEAGATFGESSLSDWE